MKSPFSEASPARAVAASFAIAFYCRGSSAVSNPRAAPAALSAALSHKLIQGFFIEASFVGNHSAPRAYSCASTARSEPLRILGRSEAGLGLIGDAAELQHPVVIGEPEDGAVGALDAPAPGEGRGPLVKMGLESIG